MQSEGVEFERLRKAIGNELFVGNFKVFLRESFSADSSSFSSFDNSTSDGFCNSEIVSKNRGVEKRKQQARTYG